MVPGQPAGLSKEEYLYASADWLISQLEVGDRSVVEGKFNGLAKHLETSTYSPQQSGPEQGSVSMATPTHSLPPPLGVGLLHSLLRVRVPGPQVVEHEPH